MRSACKDFTSPGPDTLQKQLSTAWTVFPLWRSEAKNTGLLAPTWLLFSFSHTVSHFHTLTLSLLVSLPHFTLHYYSSLLQHTTPLPLQLPFNTSLPLQGHFCLSVYLENDGGWQIWHGFLWPWPQGWLGQLPHLALTWGSLRVAWKWDWLALWAWGPSCSPMSQGWRRAGGGHPLTATWKPFWKTQTLSEPHPSISGTGQNNTEFLSFLCVQYARVSLCFGKKVCKGHKSGERGKG